MILNLVIIQILRVVGAFSFSHLHLNSSTLQVISRDLTHALSKRRPAVPFGHFLLYTHWQRVLPRPRRTELEQAVLRLDYSHSPYSPDLANFDFAIFPTKSPSWRAHHSIVSQRMTQQYRPEWYRDVLAQWIDSSAPSLHSAWWQTFWKG